MSSIKGNHFNFSEVSSLVSALTPVTKEYKPYDGPPMAALESDAAMMAEAKAIYGDPRFDEPVLTREQLRVPWPVGLGVPRYDLDTVLDEPRFDEPTAIPLGLSDMFLGIRLCNCFSGVCDCDWRMPNARPPSIRAVAHQCDGSCGGLPGPPPDLTRS
jgi:hypothetical protein